MKDDLWLRRNVYNRRNFCAFESQNLLTKGSDLGGNIYHISQLWQSSLIKLRISYLHFPRKGTDMQIEKALINDGLLVKVSWKIHIPTITHEKVCSFFKKVAHFLTVSIAFSVYNQNFTAQ